MGRLWRFRTSKLQYIRSHSSELDKNLNLFNILVTILYLIELVLKESEYRFPLTNPEKRTEEMIKMLAEERTEDMKMLAEERTEDMMEDIIKMLAEVIKFMKSRGYKI